VTDTTIYIGDLAFHEPMTVFTDVIISSLCLLFYFRLKGKDKTLAFWKIFFLFFGSSTFIGAISHAFFAVHSGTIYKIFWLTMQVTNGMAIYAAESAALQSVLRNSPSRPLFSKLISWQLILFCASVFIVQNFIVVVINTALGLIPVMIFHYKYARSNADRLIAHGILISFLTAIVHGTKLSLSAYFNSNDISHVLIMISLYYMYKGIKAGSAAKVPAK
jgi:hypothetical protein